MTDVINLTKKAFTWSVVVTTIAWSMGLAALAPLAANAAECPSLEAGDLFKVPGNSAVYLVNSDMKRMYFPTSDVYHTWYSDFSGVVTIDSACVSAYPNATNPSGINYRPGSRLIKVVIENDVYAVGPNNMRHKLGSAAEAEALYGANWTSLVRDTADVFWANYTTGSEVDGLHNGMLVTTGSDTQVWYVWDGKLYEVEGTLPTFLAGDVHNVAQSLVDALEVSGETVTAATITSNPSQTNGSSNPGGSENPVTGSVTVSLAANTPASNTVPTGAEADLLAVNFKAGSAAVKVKSIVLTRTALSNEADLDNVGIYVNGVRQGNLRSSWTSDRKMTFNFPTPITVSANSTVTVMVRGRIANSKGSYVGVGIASANDIVTESSSIAGSFPINGSLMAIAGGVTAGALYVDNALDNDVSVNFGDDDVVLAGFDLTASNGTSDSEEDVLWSGLTIENGGTADGAAVSNLRLYVDGELVDTAEMNGNTAMFDFSGYTVEKGDTVYVEVFGDIENGEENDTIEFFIKDFTAVGKDLGYRASAYYDVLDRKSDTGVSTYTLNAGDVTMNFNKTAESGTPTKEVRPDTDNVVLATLELTSNDEDVTINSIEDDGTGTLFAIDGTGLTTGEISNVELKEVGGGTYDVTATFDTDHWELSMDEEIFLSRGVKKVFQVVADLESTIDNGDSLYVLLDADAIDHEGETSGSTSLDFTPNSIQSATVDIETASLKITNSSLTNMPVVPSKKNVDVYQGKLEAGSASALRVTSLKFSTYDSGTDNEDTLFSDANISQLRLYVGSTLVKSSSNAIVEAGNNSGTGTITFSGLDINVPAGQTVTVKLQADFASSFSGAGEFALNISAVGDVVARTTGSGNVETLASGKSFVGSSATTESRQITLSTVGTLAVDMVTTDSKSNRPLYVLAGGSTPANRYVGELELTAVNEDVLVQKLSLVKSLGTATIADIDSLELVTSNGTSVAVTDFGGTTTTFEKLDYVVEEGSTVSLYIKVNAKGINVANDPAASATAGRTLQLVVGGVDARGNSTETDITVAAAGDGSPAANEYDDTDLSVTSTVMAAVATNVVNAKSDTALQGGVNKIIGEYTVSLDNGNNRDSQNKDYPLTLQELVLTFSTSSAVDVDNVQVYIKGDSSNKTTAVDDVAGVATVDLTTLTGDTEQITGSTVTLVIEADVTLGGSGTEYLQTSIEDLSSDFTWSGGASNAGDSRLTISEVTGAYLSVNNG